MLVGDPGQSIYGFRGARFENWNDFLYCKNVTKFELRTNYRSTPGIVELANVIDDRTLIRHISNGPEDEVTCLIVWSPNIKSPVTIAMSWIPLHGRGVVGIYVDDLVACS